MRSMSYFKRVFQEFFTHISEQILYRTCLKDQPFLSKTIIDFLWNFPIVKVCLHFISNFTCNDTIKESRVAAMDYF